MKKYIFMLLLPLVIGCFQGCGPEEGTEPELAYVVAYSILDSRFKTSTRMDLTADILNPMGEDMEMTKLTLTDATGKTYSLDYQTLPKFSQQGRFSAVALKVPITDLELGGKAGIEYHSPSDMHFLFMDGFEKAVIEFKNSEGHHEIEVKNLQEIMNKSREETTQWMQKEYEERQQAIQKLEEEAKKRLASKKKAAQK
jgi:hypothetical protein